MNEKTCPICHTPIPGHAPGGLCPACVLRDADKPVSYPDGAPSLEEVAAAFPRLEIIRLIGHGGMGYVYEARQPELDRTVALKVLSPALRSDPSFEERFSREARVLGKLQHPNIVTLYEHGEAGGFFYLLMEFVDGVNLRQAMSAGRFTPEQALAIVPHICDALQSAHAQGIWHRDIKPENILLDKDGRVKIADFGIARILGDPEKNFTLTLTRSHLGTAAYMAPEQHEKPHDVDHRADIYSLGVVIYEMLTGELPLGRFPAPSERAAVNARVDEIVFRTLEKERELRQQSATQVKTEVEGLKSIPTESHQQASAAATHPSPWDGSSLMKKWLIIAPCIGGSVGLVLMLLNKAGVAMSPLFLQSVIPILFLAAFAIGIIVMRRSRLSAKGLSREKTNHDEDGHMTLKSSPRLSRTALLSVCLIAVPFLAELIAPVVPGSFSEREMYPTIGHVLAILGVMGATILGWVAVSQIRRSDGRRHGLWLALIGGLFFPLLALDYLLALFFHKLGIACGWWTQLYNDRSNALLIVYSMLVWPVVDLLIILKIWKLTRIPTAASPAPATESSSITRKVVLTFTFLIITCGLLVGAANLIDELHDRGVFRELTSPRVLQSPSSMMAPPSGIIPTAATVKLSIHNGELEIMGVREFSSNDSSFWWAPNGPITDISPAIHSVGYAPSASQRRGIELYVKANFSGDDYPLGVNLYPAEGSTIPNTFIWHLDADPEASEKDIPLSIASGPWEDAGKIEAAVSTAPTGGVNLTIGNFTKILGRMEQRIIAIDRAGAIRASSSDTTFLSGPDAGRMIFTFGGPYARPSDQDLTLEKISEFRLQKRKSTPLMIRHLSLQPGHFTHPIIVGVPPQ